MWNMPGVKYEVYCRPKDRGQFGGQQRWGDGAAPRFDPTVAMLAGQVPGEAVLSSGRESGRADHWKKHSGGISQRTVSLP